MRMIRTLSAIRRGLLAALLIAPTGALAEVNVPGNIPPLPAASDFPAGVANDVANKGYHVSEIKPGSKVYWITDGNYHSLAIKYKQGPAEGVIVVDAPQPLPFFGNMPVLPAVAEIAPGVPITHFIYSHAHTDHNGGASAIVDAFPGVELIGHSETKRILEQVNDPRRPSPTTTFESELDLNLGRQRIELRYFGNTHQAGNIFVWLPQHEILMVVDVIYPGWVPFRRLALSESIRGWLAGHDAVDSFDFDVLVGGHLTRLGTKADVAIAKQYNADIKAKIDEVYWDFEKTFLVAINSLFGAGFNAFATESKWALFSAFYDASTMHCADFLDAKYNNDVTPPPAGEVKVPLAGGETFNFSNCEAYFVELRLGNVPAPPSPF